MWAHLYRRIKLIVCTSLLHVKVYPNIKAPVNQTTGIVPDVFVSFCDNCEIKGERVWKNNERFTSF